MSDATIIKEFLVGLGFKVDPASYKKFTKGVAEATNAVRGLALASAAAAATTALAINKMATSLEDLYWTSIRTKSSAANIKATGYAFSQMGSDAKSGLAALEGVASFLRSNPAAEAFVNGSLGVKTRNGNGSLRDTAATLRDIGAKLSAMPFYRARQYADMLGLGDDKALMALMRGDGGHSDKFLAFAKRMGVDLNRSAEDANKFKTQVRELLMMLEIGAVKVGTALMTWLLPNLEKFMVWARSLPEVLKRDDVKDLVKDFESLAASMNDLAAAFGVDWNFSGLIKELDSVVEALTEVVQLITAVKNGDWAEAWRLVQGGASRDPQGNVPLTGNPVRDRVPDQRLPGGGGGGTTGSAKTAMDFFVRHGWTAAQAAGIVANLKAESGFRTGAIGDGGKAFGIAQWHPDRQANFKKWAGKDIRQSTFAEQLAFVQYELTQGTERKAGQALRGMKDAFNSGFSVSKKYERPMDWYGLEAMKRGRSASQLLEGYKAPTAHLGADRAGGAGATLNQTTNVTVQGVSDPKAAGRAVAGAQAQVNGDAVRNLQGALV